ncbi:adenylate kinase [Maribacter spongiicola]|uniref:Adenylate kinase n=1 Tax=Maribacter spongiicola TaxID=1206753 RepID=A0A4R7JU95_9FLAO|nr:nucleoside monophosphate kinase [Maribacter spongiicola]TDT40499.1 adenylate kinase [Maribacter spongiicola]
MREIDILFVDWGFSKNDISKIISETKNLQIFNIQNIIRKESQDKSEIGNEILKIISNGELLNNKLIEKLITKNLRESTENLLLIFYPNVVEQFHELQRIIVKEKIVLNKIWYFRHSDYLEFMKNHFELPMNKKYLDKFGNKLTDEWIKMFQKRRENINIIKSVATSVEWMEIELHYLSLLNSEYINKRIKE